MRMPARIRLPLHVHTCECFQQEAADHTRVLPQQRAARARTDIASGCLRWHVDRLMRGNTWVTREASLQSSQRPGQCSHGPSHPGRRAHHQKEHSNKKKPSVWLLPTAWGQVSLGSTTPAASRRVKADGVMPPRPPTITIEVIKGNGIGPHGNGPVARYPIGRGQTDTYWNTKPIGSGTLSMPSAGDLNNSMDTAFACRFNHYHVEFQKYFLVKNLKVLLEKQVPEYPHMRQRMTLNGRVLEDHKELSEYGITAAAAHNLTIKMWLVDDMPASKDIACRPWLDKLRPTYQPRTVEGPRSNSSGKRVIQPVINPTGLTGHDFSTTIGNFIP